MATNHLYTLLKRYPNAPWDWYRVSANPNITAEIVNAHPDWPWDIHGLQANNIIRRLVQTKYADEMPEIRAVSLDPRRMIETGKSF